MRYYMLARRAYYARYVMIDYEHRLRSISSLVTIIAAIAINTPLRRAAARLLSRAARLMVRSRRWRASHARQFDVVAGRREFVAQRVECCVVAGERLIQ